jgi:hypothetical protein
MRKNLCKDLPKCLLEDEKCSMSYAANRIKQKVLKDCFNPRYLYKLVRRLAAIL